MEKLKAFFSSIFSHVRANKWWYIVLLGVVALVGFWQYRSRQANKPVLTFAHPEIINLTKTIDVSGIVDAKEKARLRFLAGGKVTYLGAQEGDVVKKWQTIATIDQATLNKQLNQDLNAFLKERNDWDQTLEDNKDRALDNSDHRSQDNNQYDLNNEILDVEIRNIAISNTRLYAPFAGVLTHTPTATAGVQLLSTDYFEVVNPDTIMFIAAIDEDDISSLSLGQEAILNLDAYLDEDIHTNLQYVAFTAQETSSGTVFRVEFPLDGADIQKYRLGMNGDISIIVDKKQDVLAIPFDATRERENKFYVDVRTGQDQFEEREIQVGLETDEYIEVLGGLSVDEEILLPE